MKLTSSQPGSHRGVLTIIVALTIAALTGALMKSLAEDVNAFQIVWFRMAGYFLIMLPIVAYKFGRTALRPARPGIQLFRGVCMATGTVAFILGAAQLDFANAIAILYAYPFMLTIMAVLFLGERVSWIGWLGVSGGFAGVLLVIRPDLTDINIHALFVFICAFLVSTQMLINRKLGAISHPLVTSVWGAFAAAVVLSLTMPWMWQSVSINNIALVDLNRIDWCNQSDTNCTGL